MNVAHNEEWLNNTASYFTYHQIDKRLLLTFIDFCTLVKDGRWEGFLAGMGRLPEIYEQQVHVDGRDISFYIETDETKKVGYSVSIKQDVTEVKEHFGIGFIARQKAIHRYAELTKTPLTDMYVEI